jgi:alpha-L-fucosidase
MGDWLKKYGEAIYSTRAWEKFGEGPTKMGAAHGVFENPKEGTSKDVRYTRSKDNSVLYAILLGWDQGQKEVKLTALSPDRIDLKNLKEVSLLNGAAGQYLPLTFKQDASGLTIALPEKSFDELAYALKLSFDGTIPALNKYVDLNCTPYYHLTPGQKSGVVLGADGALSDDHKNPAQQWKFEKIAAGIYKIISRTNAQTVLESEGKTVKVAASTGKENQQWKVEETFEGLLKISCVQFPDVFLTIEGEIVKGAKASGTEIGINTSFGWSLHEVCEMKQTPYKTLTIPGTIEVEDFDLGCPDDTYFDKDESNAGGKYRTDTGVDIEVCSAGGFNTGWANSGEWTAYTVDVKKSGKYKVSVMVGTTSDSGKLHLEFNGENKTGILPVLNTGGYQNWNPVTTSVELTAGKQIMKIYLDEANSGLNMDKVIFSAE